MRVTLESEDQNRLCYCLNIVVDIGEGTYHRKPQSISMCNRYLGSIVEAAPGSRTYRVL